MLTEEAVVAAVCRSLTEHGSLIELRALATEHGHDIIAMKDGQRRLLGSSAWPGLDGIGSLALWWPG
jgi:hypothetical protein